MMMIQIEFSKISFFLNLKSSSQYPPIRRPSAIHEKANTPQDKTMGWMNVNVRVLIGMQENVRHLTAALPILGQYVELYNQQ